MIKQISQDTRGEADRGEMIPLSFLCDRHVLKGKYNHRSPSTERCLRRRLAPRSRLCAAKRIVIGHLNINDMNRKAGIVEPRRNTRRNCVAFVVIALICWSLAIVFSVVVIDNQLNDLTKGHNHLPSRSIRNGAHNKASFKARGNVNYASGLPEYPIDHRNDTSIAQLSPAAITQCHRALWHTLETTTIVIEDEETFVQTGDIKDMWLRDSAAQIHPLLLPNIYQGKSLVQLDPKLERVVSGLILKTAKLIRHDPYANAFSRVIKNRTKFEKIALGRHGYVATRNYELDSGCYFMRMLYYFYQSFPDHPIVNRREVKEAVQIMVDLWIAEQRHELDAFPSGPLFDCYECGRSYWYNPNQMPRDGKGTKTNHTAGLTWSGFRPSDETCAYG